MLDTKWIQMLQTAALIFEKYLIKEKNVIYFVFMPEKWNFWSTFLWESDGIVHREKYPLMMFW